MANQMQAHSFNELPKVKIGRSSFPLPQNIKTTFNTGDLVPFFVEKDVMPADTFKYSMALVLRSQTPLRPVMDNAYLDLYFWFVPYRLCQKHWVNVMGENTETAWISQTEYVVPQITSPTGGYTKGTVANFMGIRMGVAGIKFSALPIRAYSLIYNEWFRNQNVIPPITMYDDDVDRTGNNTSPALGGKVFKAAKLPDYFTMCLPNSQKGPAVTLPIGEFAQVWGADEQYRLAEYPNQTLQQISNIYMMPNASAVSTPYPLFSHDADIESNNYSWTTYGQGPKGGAWNGNNTRFIRKNEASEGITTGLYADLAGATAATINALRFAIQTQKMLETDARNGTRYPEVILGHFGVTNSEARMQRPEYLGGKRIPIGQNQVVQTSSSDNQSPQGNLTAFSHTVSVDELFTKSFTEWGCIIGIAVVRTVNSYSQGLERGWSRRRRYDFYDPKFDNLGEMDVLNKEIFVTGNDTIDNQRFGCQEYAADYRYKPNIITGEMSPDYAQSLDSWHYGSDFSNTPTLSASFINETEANVNRTLSVQSDVSDQWLLETQMNIQATRPMALYSVPGLMDHH